MTTESPYPELKKTHTMAHVGRPWRDHKPPSSASVWAIIQGFGSYWALVAGIQLGVFDTLQTLGRSTATELAAHMDASSTHLGHLLDVLVTFGFIDQLDERYELTETAERYLCTNSPASMANLVTVAPGPHDNWARLADTVRAGHVPTPIETAPAAFYGPLVTATFPTQLRAAGRLGATLGWARRPGLRVLDLGAGRAPWAIAALTQSPESTAVINDLPGVIELTAETIAAHQLSHRVELRAGNALDIQIEADAYDLVVLGHLCRTEGETRAERLVGRAHQALKPGGQLVLADYFADNDRKRQPFAVQMGLTMVTSTRRGRMLTHAQVAGWLGDFGFEAVRLLEPIGFNQAYVAHRREHQP